MQSVCHPLHQIVTFMTWPQVIVSLYVAKSSLPHSHRLQAHTLPKFEAMSLKLQTGAEDGKRSAQLRTSLRMCGCLQLVTDLGLLHKL